MAASQKIVPAMTGRHATLVIFQDNAKKSLPFKSWNVKPNVTKHADGVNGEDRDRLDVTLNYYEFSGEMYAVDMELLQMHLAAQEARDAKTIPLDEKGAIRFTPNDGTRKSFVLQGMCIDDFDVKQGGRNEKIMFSISGRFTNMKGSQSA
jgi:hypothetical protein